VSRTDNVNTECTYLWKYWLTTLDYIYKRLINDRPDLSSERAPHRDKIVNLKKKISGQKSQIGFDTKTYWLTGRQS
jgi:hypothetical protein